MLPDMKMLNMITDSPTYFLVIPKIVWLKIYVVIKSSTDSNIHAITEFRIYIWNRPQIRDNNFDKRK